MEVLEVLHEVCAQTVPVVRREEGDVVDVHGILTREDDAEEALLVGDLRREAYGDLRPGVGGDVDGLLVRGDIIRGDELHLELRGLSTVVQTHPGGEVVGHALTETHTEEAVVLQTRGLLTMAGAGEDGIVRVAREGGLSVGDGNVAERRPAHQRLWELEGTVCDEVGVEAAVGAVVDVLEENAVHRRLDGGTGLRRVQREGAGGGSGRGGGARRAVNSWRCSKRGGHEGGRGEREELFNHIAI